MLVTTHEATYQLSELIAAAERGEDVIIARHDMPVGRLTMMEKFSGKSRIGPQLNGRKFKMGTNFDAPALNAEIADSFNGPCARTQRACQAPLARRHRCL